jgi:hypothetical protein
VTIIESERLPHAAVQVVTLADFERWRRASEPCFSPCLCV